MGEAVTDEEMTEQPAFSVIATIDNPVLPASAKGIAKKASSLGWEVQVFGATTYHEPLLLMNDGKTGQRGEVKTSAHDKHHIWVAAKHPEAPIGFIATWVDSPSAATIRLREDLRFYSRRWLSAADERLLRPSFSFVDAVIRDPIGFKVENYAVYKPIRVQREKDEAQWAYDARVRAAAETAQRQDYEYNDRTTRTEHTILVRKMGELTDFLNDYLNINKNGEQK